MIIVCCALQIIWSVKLQDGNSSISTKLLVRIVIVGYTITVGHCMQTFDKPMVSLSTVRDATWMTVLLNIVNSIVLVL